MGGEYTWDGLGHQPRVRSACRTSTRTMGPRVDNRISAGSWSISAGSRARYRIERERRRNLNVKRMVEERTDGAVSLEAGTLYVGIKRMAGDGLIEETEPPPEADGVEPGSRWRFYSITDRGRRVFAADASGLVEEVHLVEERFSKRARP